MRRASLASAGSLAAVALLLGLAAPACGDGSRPSIFTGDDEPDASLGGDASGPVLSTTCSGYLCPIPACANGGSTSISGTVYDPAGYDPLANVVVYIPSAPPGPLPTGASCDSCDSLYTGSPVAAAITDTSGRFTLQNTPAGASIPIVIQIGKWRRQGTIGKVAPCTDNALKTKLTLPSNQSEGDLPSIAVSTGGADSLECLLARIGIDPSEFMSGAGGTGRIHIFQGSAAPTDPYGAATTQPNAPLSSHALWDSVAHLMPYDVTILSCEGAETVDQPNSVPITASDQQNLLAYTAAGGRVFASHFHYAWFVTGPLAAQNVATWTRGANPITDSSNNPVSTTGADFINADIVTTFADGGAFPKGQALSQWLDAVGALNPSGPAAGELPIAGAKHNADLAGLASTPSQAWIVADPNSRTEVVDTPGEDAGMPVSVAGATEYLSFNTPFDAPLDDSGAPAYCGRVVYSDLHVGAASGDYNGHGSGGIVPSGCASNPLSPQEQALEYMLFDLSSCVTPDTGPAKPPIPIH